MFASVYVPGLPPDKASALKGCAAAFSPQMELSADMVVFSVQGLRLLMGGPEKIAQAISVRAETLGFKARIGIASNPNAAIAAARGKEGITVIQEGKEAEVLGPLPLHLLEPGAELAETLTLWGIHSFADLAALPEIGLAERLGSSGVELWNLARGSATRPVHACEEKPEFHASLELEHPVELLEPLAFILSRLLNEVCGRLVFYGLAANQVEVSLGLEEHPLYIRSIRIPFASADAGVFLRLLQYDLAAHPPPSAVVSVRIEAIPVQPRFMQTGLFIPLAPQPEKLELTLARIAAIVGSENVGAPELLDTHRPGTFQMRRFNAIEGAASEADLEPRLSIRVFRPPLSASVTAQHGHPVRISARGISGRVVAYGGPWRTSGDWWTKDPWARDEWDVELESGTLYRLFRQSDGKWFIEGNYD
jgi:protein ImuB